NRMASGLPKRSLRSRISAAAASLGVGTADPEPVVPRLTRYPYGRCSPPSVPRFLPSKHERPPFPSERRSSCVRRTAGSGEVGLGVDVAKGDAVVVNGRRDLLSVLCG